MAKKKSPWIGRNILRFCLEPHLLKSTINLSTIFKSQLGIKQFTKEELNAALEKNKSRKAAGLNKMPSEEWKTKKLDY